MSDYDDSRSTDGSDNGSDLEDFLANEEENEDSDVLEDSDCDETTEAQALVNEFPFDRSLLQESSTTNGVRRSRRSRKAPTRYQDPDYGKLMYDDVDADALMDDDDDVPIVVNAIEEDEDYKSDDESEESSDESSDEMFE